MIRSGDLARVGLAILVGVLVGAFGLRLWDINEPSIWHDEAWSIRAIQDPVNTPDDNTPPAYYALLHVLWRGAGDTPLALRYGSVLLDLLTIALAARITRRWAGWNAAILVAVLLAVSPLLWAYAREVRAYVAVPLLALVLLWLADSLLSPQSVSPWRIWIMLLVAELVLLYTHNLSVPVVAWLNIVVGAMWLWERRWRWLGIWAAGQAVVLVAYLPWVLGQSPSGTPLNTPPHVSLALAWDIWQGYFAPAPGQIGAENALVIASVLLGLVGLLSLVVLLAWHRNRHTFLVLSQALLLPVLATGLLIAANIDFHPRYYIAGLPATLIGIALGLDGLPEEYDLHGLAVPAAVALAFWSAAASLPELRDAYRHDDFHAIAAYYADLPEDAIILIPYDFEPALEVYYADRLGIRAEMLGVDLHSDADTAMAAINVALARRSGPAHIELLTWYQLPADVRGMYPCLLEAAGERLDNAYTVFGLSTQGYRITEPLALDPVPDVDVDYGLFRLAGAALHGQQAVCVRTTWALQQSTRYDWRVAGRFLTTDPPGWIIARSDTDIRADDQALTSDWAVGDQGDAFSLLRFPGGAPPGEYGIQIGVYNNQAAPNGLDRLLAGVPSGPVLALTIVSSAGATDRVERVPPREQVSIALADSVMLIGHDALGGALNPGQELRITLRWQVEGTCCENQPWTDGRLALRGDGWELAQPVRAYAAYSLDWHAFVIPAEASGPAALTIESESVEPHVLATYTIEQTDRLFAPPPFESPMGAAFTGLAVLEGFSVAPKTVTTDDVLDLTLVWRVTGTARLSYRVFTHLLDADGRVIAQHDGYPVHESRLTTGWMPGEYIVDEHALTFLPEGQGYRGPARLEVGFYDPETNHRIPVSNGGDHVVLPVEIMVE